MIGILNIYFSKYILLQEMFQLPLVWENKNVLKKYY